ncbi:uncharacterized protein G2W53_026139 [Senna tora]|uniref:Uncharacterized protein n=1 Tax=Senna tora TaxID=362788 RepID=A0A834WKY7_9FABA|nr:uncharacterized protein G2W53_026139 [Senna tora]
MTSSPIPSTSPNHAPFIPNRLICFITLPPPSSSSSFFFTFFFTRGCIRAREDRESVGERRVEGSHGRSFAEPAFITACKSLKGCDESRFSKAPPMASFDPSLSYTFSVLPCTDAASSEEEGEEEGGGRRRRRKSDETDEAIGDEGCMVWGSGGDWG